MFVRAPAHRPGGGSAAAALAPELIERARPVSSSEHQLLALSPPFDEFLPGGGLRRGTTVTTAGVAGTSLVLGLAAGPTRAGSWCAAVGWPELGAEAAHGLGLDLRRLALVPQPGPRWAEVVGTLLLGLDLVLFRPARPVKPALARRLSARARERRVVLLVLADRCAWPEPADVHLEAASRGWEGIERGSGHLRRRRVEVTVGGRRAQGRTVTRPLWLPDADGGAGRTA